MIAIVAVSPSAAADVEGIVRELRGSVTLRYEEAVQAWMPPAAVEELADQPEVAFIRLPIQPFRSKPPFPSSGGVKKGQDREAALAQDTGVVSEGVAVIGAPEWHRAGITGEGVKVGFLDTFLRYERLLGRDLPPRSRVVTRSFIEGGRMYDPEFSEGSNLHGTAVAEVVYDVSPGATFYLAAESTFLEMQAAAEWLIEQDVDVISHSESVPSGCFRGGGKLEPLIRRAWEQGTLWVASAGNDADVHWGGTFTDRDGDGRHEFSGGDEEITIEAELVEGEIRGRKMPVASLGFILSWDGPCSGAHDDYDVVIFPTDEPDRGGGGDWLWEPGFGPTKITGWTFGFPDSRVGAKKRFSVVIKRKRTGAPPARFSLTMLWCVDCTRIEHVNPEGSVGIDEPSISRYAMTVGAVHHSPERCPSWACPEGPLLWYSSRGPTSDGRIKPDIAGPTHVSTVSYGRWTGEGRGQNWGFTGTSAAQPHVAGAAALVKQAFPDYGPDDIQAFLEDRAEDLGRPGKDNQYGAGLLQLGTPAALQPPKAPTDLRVRATSPTAVELTWRDNSDNEEGFLIERRRPGGSWREIDRVERNTTEYTDRGLEPDTEYCYRVKAFNEAGTSNPTRERCATTQRELQAPTADFTFSPASPTTEDTVQFTDRSSDPDGQIVSWEWDFGDGTTSTQQNPTHRYAQAGTYTVTLTVTDNDGLTDTAEKTITVSPPPNRPPVADAGPDQTVTVGETVRLDGSRSSDPDGDPLSFEWRFLERPSGSQAVLSNPESVRTSFVADVVGRYVVELKVSDGRGGTDTDTVTIMAQKIPTYEYQGAFTLGRLGRLEVPSEIRERLPKVARFVERPHTFHKGQRSDALGEVGLRLSESTGLIFGTPSQAGQFRFLIEVQDPQQGSRTVAFLWALVTVVEPPALEVTPQQLNLTAQVGDPDPTATLTIRNSGGGTLSWEARTEAEGSWLQLQPTEGTLGAGEAQEVTVTALLGDLTAGTYRGQITVEAPGIGVAIVEVTLELQGQASEGPLTVEPSRLEFHAVAGGPNPEPQTLTLTNKGEQPLTWQATIETEEGEWLKLDFTSGPALAPGGSVVLTVSVEITGLAAGTYRGTITFLVPQNPEVPEVTVPVTLTIEGPPPPPPPGSGELLAIKFIKLEFLRPGDWQRELRDGCVIYTNTAAEPSPIRVTLPDGSVQEYEIPSGKEVIVCGDVVHIDTRP